MFSAALIVFREVLEAALIIGIIAAATRGLPQRGRWIGAGLLAGLAGSIGVAATTDVIAEWASGLGQELFNAAILGIAVVMLAWHNIWMATHGRELAAHARHVGQRVRDGAQECSVLFLIIAVAVLREGSETVLFLYGTITAESDGLKNALTGGTLGLLGGVAIGALMYGGLLRIPLRWFFSATSVLVLLLASGMASQATRFLVQADLIPSLGDPIWDTSAWLSPHSPAGTIAHGLMGYDAAPAGVQVIAYVTVFLVISLGMAWVNRSASSPRQPQLS